jgi:hypothetical protein
VEKCAQKKLKTSLTESALLEMSGYVTNSLLKKASELAIASAVRNSSSLKANKKRDSMSQRASK